MAGIGYLLIAVAIIALIYGLLERRKASRVTAAPFVSTGDAASKGMSVAGPKGQISVQGQVMCQQPVYSPVTGTPCLFYELKVTAEWKDGDTTKTKEIDHQKVAAQTAINDGSGPIWIDMREGGDFEPSQSKRQEQSTGLLKGIVGGELVFGNYRINAGILSLGTKYIVEEKVFPVQPSLYVCGKLADGGGMITGSTWSALIISNKTRDNLLASAMKNAKIALIVAGAGAGVGIILAVIAAVTGPSKAELEAQAKAEASAAAAAAAAMASQSAAAMPTDDPSAEPTATGSAAAPVKPGTKPVTTKPSTATTKPPTTTKPTPKK